MPIYEFKCLNCNECMEILVMGADSGKVEMRCKQCGSEDLERILSSTNYAMAAGSGNPSQACTQSRTCSSGSCTTWNLPGHSK
jgi:putative FmdB family regulatory protein